MTTTLAAGARLGRYEIESLVGAGGMGEVYRARDTRLGRPVAIKILPPHLSRDPVRRERFAREARILSTLSHAHIRALYDIGSHDFAAPSGPALDFLVMEYLDGETLDRLLARRALPLARAITIAQQIAGALGAAHRQGVIHGDIKPANIMLTASGAKLLDFGVARLWRDVVTPPPAVLETATDTTSIPGTTPYMAPEQLEGDEGDPRSDLFALGVVLYEMLTGRRPFDGPTRARIIAAILEHEPPPLVSAHDPIPAPLERVVFKCLAKNPDDRWQNAQDLASELAWMAAPDARGPAAPRRVPSRTALATVAGMAVVALSGLWGATRPAAPAPAGGHVIRFLADAPHGSSMTVAPGAFAVSPDGRYLAFVATVGSGSRALWLRSLDSFEAHPLRGTDDAWNPFWAPDSRTIGFRAGSRIRSVEIETQTAQTICELQEPTSGFGAWGAGGEIIFTTERGLYKVSGNGGTPQLMARQTAEERFEGPEFLPDGDHYLVHVRTPSSASIHVAAADGSMRRPVVDADSQALYAEPGYLMYVRAGALYAHPFDTRTLRTTGEPRALPELVSVVPAISRGAFSLSRGNVLAYRAGVMDYELIWLDRSGRRLESLGSGPYINPSISHDGARVAVTRYNPSLGTSDIWVFESNRAGRQLTSDNGVEDFATWAPDDRRIIFSSNRTGVAELYQKGPDAAASDADEPVAANRRGEIPMDWTREGRLLFLAFEGRGALGARLWTMPIGSPAESVPLTSSAPGKEEGQGQVSPDGHWLAYVSDVTGSPQIYVRPFPSGAGRWLVSSAGGMDPHWRGDGRELYYLAPDQTMMAVDIRPGLAFSASDPHPLFRIALVGGYLGAPFPNARIRNEYEASPDGRRFLISQPVGGTSAYAIRVLVNWPALLLDGAHR